MKKMKSNVQNELLIAFKGNLNNSAASLGNILTPVLVTFNAFTITHGTFYFVSIICNI